MAERPVFIPRLSGDLLVETRVVEFTWSPGMSLGQKQKSIASLHRAAQADTELSRLLEISTKSPDSLGVALSAFNLTFSGAQSGKRYALESMFQSAKIFELGGPYRDLLDKSPREAKKDPRLKNSGQLLRFTSGGVEWPLEPKTAFYDWLYLNVLSNHAGLAEQLRDFDAFTDIEFNPKKSINCQAYSAALYVALSSRSELAEALKSKETFLATLGRYQKDSTEKAALDSGSLF